jgi:hypothetical protein
MLSINENPGTMSRGETMMGYLPDYYRTSRVMRAVLEAQGNELEKLYQAFDNILDQLFIDTASWRLDYWEEELGLKVMPEQPVEQRRDKIKSRLRGQGTATIKLVKQVAETYDKGKVDVIEDVSSYTVTLRFIDTIGIPANLEDLKAAVRAVVPAHLALEFDFNYFIWDELDKKNWTWDELDGLHMTWDELAVYK